MKTTFPGFFQSLQQSIESRLGELVDLVDDEDFESISGSIDVYAFEDRFANVVNSVCEAASISSTSIDRLSEISMHDRHASGSSYDKG